MKKQPQFQHKSPRFSGVGSGTLKGDLALGDLAFRRCEDALRQSQTKSYNGVAALELRV
jgi:hypothetical protein